MSTWRVIALAGVVVSIQQPAQAFLLFDQGPDTGSVRLTGDLTNMTGSTNWADKVDLFYSSAVVTDYLFFTGLNPADNSFTTMQVTLRSDASDSPGAVIATESVDATNFYVYGADPSNTYYEVDLKLTTPWTLSSGTQYWIGASGNGFDAGQLVMTPSNSSLADGQLAQFDGSTFTGMNTIGDQAFALEGTPTPEPASMVLVGLGIAGLIAGRRK